MKGKGVRGDFLLGTRGSVVWHAFLIARKAGKSQSELYNEGTYKNKEGVGAENPAQIDHSQGPPLKSRDKRRAQRG